MRELLFLCTGNYYRSRYAEILFNLIAGQQGLNWRASSRGLAVEFGINNVGPISPFALERLERRGVTLPEPIRFPQKVTDHDFAGAHQVIALNEPEHRPLMEVRFPHWRHVVQYWRVRDVDELSPDEALLDIEEKVSALITTIAPLPGRVLNRL